MSVSTKGAGEETGNFKSDKVAVRSDPEIRQNGILPWHSPMASGTRGLLTRKTLLGLVGKSHIDKRSGIHLSIGTLK